MSPLFGFGIDLGLTTGAVVAIACSSPKGFYVEDATVLSSWNEQNNLGVRLRSTPDEVAVFAQTQIIRPLSNRIIPGMTVGIDWTPQDVFWGARLTAVKKAFLMGYVYMGILTMGGRPLILPPDLLRKYAGLPRGASKEKVQGHYFRYWRDVSTEPYNEHEVDSIILAQVGVRIDHDSELKAEYEKTKVSSVKERKARRRRRRRSRT